MLVFPGRLRRNSKFRFVSSGSCGSTALCLGRERRISVTRASSRSCVSFLNDSGKCLSRMTRDVGFIIRELESRKSRTRANLISPICLTVRHASRSRRVATHVTNLHDGVVGLLRSDDLFSLTAGAGNQIFWIDRKRIRANLNNAEKGGLRDMDYAHLRKISSEEFIDLLNRSTFGRTTACERSGANRFYVGARRPALHRLGRRPIGRGGQIRHGFQLLLLPIGFGCGCLISKTRHWRGIVGLTQSLLHPKCTMILLAAPKAEGYYPKIGMVRHHSAWTRLASPLLATKNT